MSLANKIFDTVHLVMFGTAEGCTARRSPDTPSTLGDLTVQVETGPHRHTETKQKKFTHRTDAMPGGRRRWVLFRAGEGFDQCAGNKHTTRLELQFRISLKISEHGL